MIRPLLPASSLARLTVFPGEFSTSSVVGMESPVLTMIAGVEENSLALLVDWMEWRLRWRWTLELELWLLMVRSCLTRCREIMLWRLDEEAA